MSGYQVLRYYWLFNNAVENMLAVCARLCKAPVLQLKSTMLNLPESSSTISIEEPCNNTLAQTAIAAAHTHGCA